MRAALALALLAAGLTGMDCGYAQTGAAASFPAAAQPAAAAATEQEDSLSRAPVIKLDFKTQPAIRGVNASPVFVNPVLCASDGIPFVDFPQLPDFMEHTIYALDPKGARAFSLDSVSGLYDARYQSFLVADSWVGILVNATKDDKHSVESYYALPGISTKKTPRYTGEHHEYLVEFGRDGNLKSVLDLPVAYHFHRVAALSNGELLALAYDRTNAVARLLLLDSNGQVVRALVVPSEMQDSPGLVQGQSGPAINRARAETSLSWWLMAPVRQSLLLYQAHSASPVLEVGVGGATREVPLEAPKGYVLDGVVPANDRWIMRYRRQGLSDSGQIDARPEAGNYVLYEVNPSDGSLKTELDTGTGPLFNIACEQDGVITAFSMNGDKIARMTADIPR
jgi:hypothetical protein